MAHMTSRLILIVLAWIVYVVMLVFAALAAQPAGEKIGLYKNSTGDISDKFYLYITPPGWTFSIWGFIFTWQLLWMIYVLTTICRVTQDGRHIYELPIQTNTLYVSYTLNSGVTIGWLLLWDRQYMGYALLDIVFCALTLYICVFITHRNLFNSIQTLKEQERNLDIWLERFLVHNGLIFYTTWITIATLLNFGIALHYEWGVELYLASTIPLACLSLVIVCWFVLETFVLDKYVRYTFSEYIVLVVALAGSLSKNFDLDTNYRNSIFTVVLLAVAGLFALVKLVVMIYRHRKYPIHGNFRDLTKAQLG